MKGTGQSILTEVSKKMCKHTDGWVLEEPVIHTDQDNDNIEVEAHCNTIGCNEKRTFNIDVSLNKINK